MNQQPNLFLFSTNCADCDVDLEDWGRNLVTLPISKKAIEVCDDCAAYRAAGLKGEIQAQDGTIYHYLYLPHSQVTSFSMPNEADKECGDEYDPDEEEYTGSYSPKYGPFWVTGTKPYKHLEELAAKFLEICPDAHERAVKLREEKSTQ